MNSFGGYFDISTVKAKIAELEKEMSAPNFWNDQKKATKITKRMNDLQAQMKKEKKITDIDEDLETYQLLLEEEFQKDLLEEAEKKLRSYQKLIEKMEIESILNEKTDSNDAVLTIHPGAGGTESQDWAEMLLRMYQRWIEKNDFKSEIIDLQPGDEAGIKSVTLEIFGSYAFGYLKAEAGIHRLVRISPFNAQGKRQTSFASVFVYPIIDDDIQIDIDPNDLRIDTYRSSGKGGQGVNTTDSAVRITHLPSNIIVQCQNERSQLRNKEVAMQILRSRLYQLLEEKREKEKQKLENKKTEIGWGNQIRSYVFHPYQMVKDHRTEYETGNISNVMDGNIDEFIDAYLKMKIQEL